MEDCSISQQGSPLKVLAHERGTLCMFLCRDLVEDLRTAILPGNSGYGSGSGTSVTETNGGMGRVMMVTWLRVTRVTR